MPDDRDHGDHISLREYIERIMDERDRAYDTRFKAAEEAVKLALATKTREGVGKDHSVMVMVVAGSALLAAVVAIVLHFTK